MLEQSVTSSSTEGLHCSLFPMIFALCAGRPGIALAVSHLSPSQMPFRRPYDVHDAGEGA
jgi:hypothetical protein